MSEPHTKEPWHVGDVAGSPTILDANCNLVHPSSEDNANRIVQCVNACAGKNVNWIKECLTACLQSKALMLHPVEEVHRLRSRLAAFEDIVRHKEDEELLLHDRIHALEAE